MSTIAFTGRAGQHPEIRRTPNGTAVLAISIADSRTWLDKKSEERKEVTEWHRTIMFGDYAERLAERLGKGDLVEVVGELRYRSYTNKDTVEVRVAEIYPSKFKILQHNLNNERTEPAGSAGSDCDGGVPLPAFHDENYDDSDIPF